MRPTNSLPVLSDESGEVVGSIAARPGLVTDLGVISRVDVGGLVAVDGAGVTALLRGAMPWVFEAEARRWGFVNQEALTTAMAV
ncbi:hypothetical protein NNJEOMEG_02225 [Fundidesulfovibrio magnetotacticus]|uniref:Uncharacterized protein n=1 Tax=Fundidesulfovibrio magnetotacticus TaxID=2730080 RepID=A0A6V8LUX1_9BACT|nr:hypothetical protein [Fundidesulfovibrio magnetotacticus]GFK94381.1 hypothetical protein NNJEOMEG_02225 [Fundidesulfovibrio magnetotacticus]